ncbi:MAG TPA: hypothetical protein VFT45_05605 [Longimicrobium sp.]|nr:hypothetical protein [Longimicrobium sp.]
MNLSALRLARVVTLSLLATACARSGAREPAVDQALVIPGTDTVFSATPSLTDTADARRVWTPPPNDCRYTDARPQPRMGDPRHWEPYDSATMAQGVEYRCVLRPTGPEVRLVVRGEWGIPMVVDVHSPPDAARSLQRLALDNDERARQGADLVEGEDLNGDGWTDLRMRTFSGTGGVMYDVFLYAPAQRAFVPDTVLSGEGNVRGLPGSPCAETGWRMALGVWSGGVYCWKDGNWILTRTLSQDRGEKGGYIRTHSELRGNALKIVRVDTLTDPNEGLSP